MKSAVSTAVVPRLTRWMIDECLPFWAENGRSATTGLFFECMTPEGQPDASAPLRFRVQCRQIYSLSHAAVLGWLPQGAALAHQGFERMMAAAWAPDGHPGFVHVLNADATVRDARRDSYDHAFAVLALSWLKRATGDPKVKVALDATIDWVDTVMTDRFGALTEGLPASLPRRQNPQMHWFEAMLALHEAAGDPRALDRAARHRAFMEAYLVEPETDTLGEYFTDDWAPAAGAAGASVEPGHLAEWTWLLRRHEAMSGSPQSDLPSRLLATAARSCDPATGLLVDECDRSGRPIRGTCRSWLATEWAKAWIAEAEAGIPDAAQKAMLALETLERAHLARPFRAGWIDQLDERGTPVPGPVPSSILYHVFVAVAEADRVFGPQGNSAT